VPTPADSATLCRLLGNQSGTALAAVPCCDSGGDEKIAHHHATLGTTKTELGRKSIQPAWKKNADSAQHTSEAETDGYLDSVAHANDLDQPMHKNDKPDKTSNDEERSDHAAPPIPSPESITPRGELAQGHWP